VRRACEHLTVSRLVLRIVLRIFPCCGGKKARAHVTLKASVRLRDYLTYWLTDWLTDWHTHGEIIRKSCLLLMWISLQESWVQRKGRIGPTGEDKRSGKKGKGWEKGKDGNRERRGRWIMTWMITRWCWWCCWCIPSDNSTPFLVQLSNTLFIWLIHKNFKKGLCCYVALLFVDWY
jgi:hypothetical protein